MHRASCIMRAVSREAPGGGLPCTEPCTASRMRPASLGMNVAASTECRIHGGRPALPPQVALEIVTLVHDTVDSLVAMDLPVDRISLSR